MGVLLRAHVIHAGRGVDVSRCGAPLLKFQKELRHQALVNSQRFARVEKGNHLQRPPFHVVVKHNAFSVHAGSLKQSVQKQQRFLSPSQQQTEKALSRRKAVAGNVGQ